MIETEQDGSIPFLDISLWQTQDKLITNCYTKPTSSGRIVNVVPNLPHYQRINTAKNFINTSLNYIDSSHKNIMNKII